jgi:hypothetical protein
MPFSKKRLANIVNSGLDTVKKALRTCETKENKKVCALIILENTKQWNPCIHPEFPYLSVAKEQRSSS